MTVVISLLHRNKQDNGTFDHLNVQAPEEQLGL